MTTVKEFEKQKQEISDFIIKNIATSAKINQIIDVDKMLNNLQPPRPTCGTCKRHESNGGHGLYSLTHCQILRLEPSEQFCCINHSDYEVIKND